MACKGKHFCASSVMRDCHELNIDVQKAVRLNGMLYLFVITFPDGTKKGYRFGIDLMHDLRAMKKALKK